MISYEAVFNPGNLESIQATCRAYNPTMPSPSEPLISENERVQNKHIYNNIRPTYILLPYSYHEQETQNSHFSYIRF